jgi:hypothetical protein
VRELEDKAQTIIDLKSHLRSLQDSKEKQEKDNETQELKDFKDQYTTWFNGLLKTQEGRQELIALRLNTEVRAVVSKVLN